MRRPSSFVLKCAAGLAVGAGLVAMGKDLPGAEEARKTNPLAAGLVEPYLAMRKIFDALRPGKPDPAVQSPSINP